MIENVHSYIDINRILNICIYSPIIEPSFNHLLMLFPDFHVLLGALDLVLSPLSYLLVYKILWSNYCNYFWKNGFLSKKHGIPNINGEWEGELKSSKKNSEGEYIQRKMMMTVNQTFIKMQVTCYFYNAEGLIVNSKSKSDIIAFYFDNSFWSLKFSFKNHSSEVGTNAVDYCGYNEFEIDPLTNEITGFYFTGRDTGQHRGEMNLKKTIKGS